MFEQSVLTDNRTPWSLALSTMLQAAICAAILLVSVWSFDKLPVLSLPVALPPLPRLHDIAVKLVPAHQPGAKTASGLTAPSAAKPFLAPSRVPVGVASVVDNLAIASMPDIAVGQGNGAGVAGALPGGNGSVLDGIAPPPKPSRTNEVTHSASKPHLRLGGDVLAAKLIQKVLPGYPPLARSARISGRVQLMSVIARDGSVQNLQVVSGHPLLVKAAVDAVRQWRYSPTMLNGEPVEVMAPIEVNFVLSQ